MSKLILNTECRLYTRDGKAFCTSRQIADEFEKRHADILRIIYDKIDSAKEDSEKGDNLAAQFCTANFIESNYIDRGKRYPEYLLTKSGFSFIAMGLTGKTADRFKIAYINRFEQMEIFIESLGTARLEHPAFTNAIQNAHEEPKHYHFSNEADMINRIVLGMNAKKFRETNGIPKGESIRPYLSAEQIKAIEELQRTDIGLLLAVPDFEIRKQLLTNYFQQMQLKRIA